MSRRVTPLYFLALVLPLMTACDTPTASAPVRVDVEAPLAAVQAASGSFTEVQEIGMFVFQDLALSLRRNQSCASCHDKAWGFGSPNSGNSQGGAIMAGSTGKFGTRKVPSAAYVAPSPVRFFDPVEGFVGGSFWDGRVVGTRLGSPVAEQALLPFLSLEEQALPDLACVLFGIKQSFYATRFGNHFGPGLASIKFPTNTDQLCRTPGATLPLSAKDRATALKEYDNVGRSVLEWESSVLVNAFSSKHDAVIDGVATFTAQEQQGLALFTGKANCASCHPNAGRKALFTKYTYQNIGVSRNPLSPAVTANPLFKDLGLGGALADAAFNGKMKVPTLRNVDKRVAGGTKAYMHNGAFKTLDQVVHFYNTRDVLPRCGAISAPIFGVNCWRAPEVTQNLNTVDVGNLGLTLTEEKALVAYLKTLSDGFYKPVI